MADLLETVIEAYGGLDRWKQLDAVSVHGANGSVLMSRRSQGRRWNDD